MTISQYGVLANPPGRAAPIQDGTNPNRLATVDADGDLQVDVSTGDLQDMNTGLGSDEHLLVGIALPADGGHVVGGTSSNPLIVSVSSGDMGGFAACDYEEYSSTVTYVGKEAADGTWMIMSITSSSTAMVIRYASVTNNPTRTNYAQAWAYRNTLTYQTFGSAF